MLIGKPPKTTYCKNPVIPRVALQSCRDVNVKHIKNFVLAIPRLLHLAEKCCIYDLAVVAIVVSKSEVQVS